MEFPVGPAEHDVGMMKAMDKGVGEKNNCDMWKLHFLLNCSSASPQLPSSCSCKCSHSIRVTITVSFNGMPSTPKHGNNLHGQIPIQPLPLQNCV